MSKVLNTYQKCTDWLFEKFPAYQQQGASAYKPGLERVEHILSALQIQAQRIPSIHIAGTNGKGSTAAYISSLLTEQNYKVGLFTSPHIYDFSERIRINGKCIEQDFAIAFCNEIQANYTNLDASFFELTFAMALAYFETQKCDYMVIETGLGGRLDATNVIQPKLSVITNISLDHQEFLGNTLPAIAAEKAGIIKRNTPVLIGEKQPETVNVFHTTAETLNAPIYFSEDFTFPASYFGNFVGYPFKNLRNAFAALQILDINLDQNTIEKGLKNLKQNTGHFGRFEKIHEDPKVLADVSHNIDGIKATLPMIQEQLTGRLYILYGAAKDKDAAEIIALFPKEARLAACTFSNPRSKTIADWQSLGLNEIYTNVNVAIKEIMAQMHTNDLLWITGSFFLIADLEKESDF